MLEASNREIRCYFFLKKLCVYMCFELLIVLSNPQSYSPKMRYINVSLKSERYYESDESESTQVAKQ